MILMIFWMIWLIECDKKIIIKVGGIFLLKFSTEMLIRTMNETLTHNGTCI